MVYDGKVIIHTAFYKQQTVAAYCQNLLVTCMVLKELGIPFDYSPRPGDFHPERAVNDSLSRFLEDPEATDWFNIDSDHGWDAEAFVKMLLRPEPVLAGSYKMTNEWGKYTGVPKRDEEGAFLGQEIGENQAILEADRVAAGFLRIKKPVIEKYVEMHPEDYFHIRESGDKVYRFFWNEVIDNEFTGMDMAFSEKLKALGYQLWIYPNIDISHWGPTENMGNLDKHLKAENELTRAKEALRVARGV